MSAGARPLSAAVIGFGQAGQTFHAPLVDASPGLRLCAVTTRDPERASLARRRYPGVSVYASPGELYEAVPDLDLVVIATPNDAHVPEALTALERGLAVVIDKPFALSVLQGRRLLSVAATRGGVLTVFQNRRWDSDHLTLRRLLDEGQLGEVWRYEARYEFYRPGPAPARTNGLLLGLGSHLVDQALQLLGPAVTVYGEVRTRIGDQDDDAFVAIGHASGAQSHLWMSSRAPAAGPRLRVIGSSAQFQIDHLDTQETLLRAEHRLPPLGEPTEPESNWGLLSSGAGARAVPAEPGAWASFYPAVERAIRGEGEVPVDPAEALEALIVIEAARASTSTHTVVAL